MSLSTINEILVLMFGVPIYICLTLGIALLFKYFIETLFEDVEKTWPIVVSNIVCGLILIGEIGATITGVLLG